MNDLPAYEDFAFRSHIGVTSLPRNPDLLKGRIELSMRTFGGEERDRYKQLYIFVLERSGTGELAGTSAIKVKTGNKEPLYFYRMETLKQEGSLPEIPKEIRVMTPQLTQEEASELIGLYILKEYRKEGLGHLASYGRLMYVAEHPEDFEEKIFANIRGIIDENDNSLFWQQFGKYFFDVSFQRLFELVSENKISLPEILPKYPIYIDLLTQEVQNLLGEPHHRSRPAYKMLLENGFKKTQDIDITDGGPKIEAHVRELDTVKNSITAKIKNVDNNLKENTDYIIATQDKAFRGCLGHIEEYADNEIGVSSKVAEALLVKPGDIIRYTRNLDDRKPSQ